MAPFQAELTCCQKVGVALWFLFFLALAVLSLASELPLAKMGLKQDFVTEPQWWLLVLSLLCAIIRLLSAHQGLRRTGMFWRNLGPMVARYNWILYRFEGEEQDRRLEPFFDEIAPKLAELCLDMGGIYVKVAQLAVTIGEVFLPSAIVHALQPLQNGVRPRDSATVQRLIERELGKPIDDIFSSFEYEPLGAASIAQAHRAILRDTKQDVVVKVQYPEVAKLFDIDFANFLRVTRRISPERVPMILELRNRHCRELDFRNEAENLLSAAKCLTRSDLPPHYRTLVKIPTPVSSLLLLDPGPTARWSVNHTCQRVKQARPSGDLIRFRCYAGSGSGYTGRTGHGLSP